MKKPLLSFIASLAFLCGYTQVGEHIETDRPNETEVPYTVPKKYFQLEAGIRIEKVSENNRIFSYPAMLVKYGLSEKIEVRAKTSYSTQISHYIPDDILSSGLQPLEIGIKAAVLKEQKWIPKTAFLLQTGIPQFSSGIFKTSHLAPVLRVLMENNVTDKFSINYNAGAEWNGDETALQWLYTLTPGIDIGEHVHLFGEVYSYLQKKETPEFTLDGGIEYFIGKNIGLDVCSGFGLNKAASPFFITFGGSVRFR